VFACCPPSLPIQAFPARGPPSPSIEISSLPAVHDALVVTPPQKSPFQESPVLGQFVSPRQMFPACHRTPSATDGPRGTRSTSLSRWPEIYSWPALNRTNKLGVPPNAVHRSCWSGVSLEDDLVHDSVSSNKPAHSHNGHSE
jgi:hypothetical protein